MLCKHQVCFVAHLGEIVPVRQQAPTMTLYQSQKSSVDAETGSEMRGELPYDVMPVEAWAKPKEGTTKVSRGQDLRNRFEARGYKVPGFSQKSGISTRTLYRMFDDDPTVGEATWIKAEQAIAEIEAEHGLDFKFGDAVVEVKQQRRRLPKDDGPYTMRIFHPDTGQLLITFDGGDPDEVRRVAVQAYRDLMASTETSSPDAEEWDLEP